MALRHNRTLHQDNPARPCPPPFCAYLGIGEMLGISTPRLRVSATMAHLRRTQAETLHTHACHAAIRRDKWSVPAFLRSSACPRRRSCGLYSHAFGVPTDDNMYLRLFTVAFGVKSLKSFVPRAAPSKSSIMRCTTHVRGDFSQVHFLFSMLPSGLFFRRLRVKTNMPSSTHTAELPGSSCPGAPAAAGSASEGTRRRKS